MDNWRGPFASNTQRSTGRCPFEDAERKLHTSARRVAAEAEKYRREGKYREALQRIATLRPEVDDFFDSVMVMAEQEELRRNRLTLLAELLKEFSRIADF